MEYGMAQARSAQVEPDEVTRVRVDIAIGTYNKLTLYEKGSGGRYEQEWSEGYSSRVGGVEFEAATGSIVYQRTVSPASADPLERYGVVLPGGRIDWGTEIGRIVDFGPVGSATRPGLHGPSPSVPIRRGRVFASHGEEVVGGAVSDVSTTSGD